MNLYDILELSEYELSHKTQSELASIQSVLKVEYDDLMEDYSECNSGPSWYDIHILPIQNQLTVIESVMGNTASNSLPEMLTEFLDSEYGRTWEFIGLDDEWANIKVNTMLLEYNITHFE